MPREWSCQKTTVGKMVVIGRVGCPARRTIWVPCHDHQPKPSPGPVRRTEGRRSRGGGTPRHRGTESWTTKTCGTVVRTERRRHGLHFQRNHDDKVFSDVVLLELPDGELTSVTIDEFTTIRRA